MSRIDQTTVVEAVAHRPPQQQCWETGPSLDKDSLDLSTHRRKHKPRPVPPPVVDPVDPPVVNPVPPPLVDPVDPPVVNPVPPPVVDPVDPPVVNPVPPPPHVPRYFWMPTWPEILPTEPRALPRIAMPAVPSGPEQIDPSAVTSDPFELVAGDGRLRTSQSVNPVSILAGKGQLYGPATGHWWTAGIKVHSQINAADAQKALSDGTLFYKDGNGYQSITSADQLMPYVQEEAHPHVSASEGQSLLAKGQPVFLATNGSFQPIESVSDLASAAHDIKARKLQDLQNAANSRYQQQVQAANDQDIQNREAALPAFNSIYNMERLNMDNMMVSEGGRNFNQNLITAMNLYNQHDTRQKIAEKWHENPDMSTREFNQMANSVITEEASQLFWQANWSGDSWDIYLGQQAVPGLRYPDTQQDVEYNTQRIQRVASQLPMLLSSSVLQ